MAHAGETHLFLEKIFDLQSPSWPWRNPNWKTQAWIKCAGDTSNSSNWNHFKILKCKKPLFIFKQSTIYLWLNLPQKLSQPVAFQRFSPSLPFFEQVQTPLPLLKFLSSFTPHYISLGDDYDEEDMSADVYHKVLSWNNLGELQKPSPPSVSTFDILLMDSKFRNFPPLLFRPPLQNRLAENPAEQHSTTWIRTEQSPPKCGDFCWRLS